MRKAYVTPIDARTRVSEYPRPRRKPAQARSNQKVEWILEGATRVFDRQGLRGTTNLIAAEAGVSVGTLYEYFPNKQALLGALAERHLEDALTRVNRLLDGWRLHPPSLVEALIGDIVDAIIDAHVGHPSLHRLLAGLAPAYPAVTRRAMDLQKRLLAAMSSETVRLQPDLVDADRRAKLIVATISTTAHSLLEAGGADVEQWSLHLRSLAIAYMSRCIEPEQLRRIE